MYFNVRQTLVSGYDASVSFTTAFQFQNFDCGAVQIVWTGLDGTTGTARLRASIDESNWDSLTTDPITMLQSAGNQIYNITDGGYEKVQVVYAANGNSTGTIDVVINQKSRR